MCPILVATQPRFIQLRYVCWKYHYVQSEPVKHTCAPVLPCPQHLLLLSLYGFRNVGRCMLSLLFLQELFRGRGDIITCLCSWAQTVSDIK